MGKYSTKPIQLTLQQAMNELKEPQLDITFSVHLIAVVEEVYRSFA